MIATAEEYLQQLWQLYDGNVPTKAIVLPRDETIYEIDLNTRTIKAPYLSGITKDQNAETFYFIVDRFHGEIDLVNTACLVYYKNKTSGTGSFYPVPFYDITTFSTYVTNSYIEVFLNDTTYKPYWFYTRNSDNQYVLSTGSFDEDETYYEYNDTSKNKKYEKVKVTQQSYQPNKYYYFDNRGETPTLTYILDQREEFDEEEVYYALVEARYINAHVEYSNYKPRQYYLLNDNNEFVLDVGPFNKDAEYYALMDQPKILFPWTIKNPATDAAGDLEFAIRFYQIDNYGTEEEPDMRLVYNLNTKSAVTRIQDTLHIEITDEDFDDDANQSRENAPDYWEFLGGNSATVLEDIYYRLQILERQNEIYWLEADTQLPN